MELIIKNKIAKMFYLLSIAITPTLFSISIKDSRGTILSVKNVNEGNF